MEETVKNYLTVPVENRDFSWKHDFFGAIVEASFVKGDTFIGPDGFSYTTATLLSDEGSQVGQKISEFLDGLLTQGTGLVVYDERKIMLWVFTYGNLCSLKQYGTFERGNEMSGTNKDIVTDTTSSLRHSQVSVETRTVQEPRDVLIGQPNESYLPPYARNVVREYLLKQGIQNPKIFLWNDTTLQPHQSLVFSLFTEDFPSPESFRTFMERLAWFFPPPGSIISIPKHQAEMYQEYFQPL